MKPQPSLAAVNLKLVPDSLLFSCPHLQSVGGCFVTSTGCAPIIIIPARHILKALCYHWPPGGAKGPGTGLEGPGKAYPWWTFLYSIITRITI